MHRISRLVISNYKACREIDLPLDDFTPLVGQNNCGKSTILRSLAWVLKPGKIEASDFSDPSNPMIVTVRIDGITADLIKLIPEEKHQKAIAPFCINETLWIRAEAAAGGKPTQSLWEAGEHSGEGVPAKWRPYPTGIAQAVSAIMPEPLFIEAMHDVSEDLGKAKAGSTIKSLLDEIMGPLLKAHSELNESLEKIRSILSTNGTSRSGHLIEFDKQATSSLQNFFPGLSLELDLEVIDIKEFFKAGSLQVIDVATGDKRKFDQLGTGAQRSIQMSLIRHLSEIRSGDGASPVRRLLLIDEPELYLHPQGARRLRTALKALSKKGFQVVFSTHSPLMIDRDSASTTVVINRPNGKGSIAQLPLKHAVADRLKDAQSQGRTLFELGNISEIYFSERVVLCEGKTDRRLLPLAYERVYGNPPEHDRIAFISLGACSDIPKALPVLEAMAIQAFAIVDLDFAFVSGRTSVLPSDGLDLAKAKALLKIMATSHGWKLGDNGLPTKSSAPGKTASELWAQFAVEKDASAPITEARKALLVKGIWAWSKGCIEDVIGSQGKGEDAIIENESKFMTLTPEEIRSEMPEMVASFEWIRGGNK